MNSKLVRTLELNFNESTIQSVQNEEEIKRNPMIGLESSYLSLIGSNWGSKWDEIREKRGCEWRVGGRMVKKPQSGF